MRSRFIHQTWQWPMGLLLIVGVMMSAAAVTPGGPDAAYAPGNSAAAEQTAKPAPQPPDPRFASPRATLGTFLDALAEVAKATADDDKDAREAAMATALMTLDLSKVNQERGPQLAARLLGILNRLGPFRSWYLWDKQEASGRNEQVYFPHPRFDWILALQPDVDPQGSIVLKVQPDGHWLFSAPTLAGLDALYISMEPLPVRIGQDEKDLSSELWLRQLMPASLKGKSLLTLEYWQWVGLMLFIFLGLVLDHGFRLIVRSIAIRIIRRQGSEPDPQRMRLAVRPAGLSVVALFWLNLVWLLGLPDLAFTIVQTAARIFAVLAITWFAWRFTDLIADALARKAERTETKLDDVLVPLLRTTAKILIVIIALIYGGLSLNVDITPLLASLTIGGVGFAFAAKDTLENFFGSATVLVDQPFGVGDTIVIADVEGTVERIGFRSTRVRTFYDSLVTIPNANLVRATVDNYGRRRFRRYNTNIGIEYGTPPETMISFVEGIRELIRTHPDTRKDSYHVWFSGFGASSLDILLWVFFEVPDWGTYLRDRERLLLDIMRLAERLDVSFAFPTQTLHLHQDNSTPPAWPEPDAARESEARLAGREIARQLTLSGNPEARPGARGDG